MASYESNKERELSVSHLFLAQKSLESLSVDLQSNHLSHVFSTKVNTLVDLGIEILESVSSVQETVQLLFRKVSNLNTSRLFVIVTGLFTNPLHEFFVRPLLFAKQGLESSNFDFEGNHDSHVLGIEVSTVLDSDIVARKTVDGVDKGLQFIQ